MSTEVREQPIWLAEGDDKHAAVREMFGSIAPKYDSLNGVMSLGRHRAWRRDAVRKLELKPGDSALDVCCGTGDFLLELRTAVGPTGHLTGLDFCSPMLEIARTKLGDEIELVCGDACALPFSDSTFDAVTVGWGIRNVRDVDLAHAEIWRVLKPGGRFVSLDMAIPRNWAIQFGSRMFSRLLLPLLGRVSGSREAYTYLPRSAERFMSREDLVRSMSSAGFVNVKFRDVLLGNLCMHDGEKP